jgi:hypothetical protein
MVTRRMPLRQLLTHSEKCARDMIEQLKATVGPALAEFRDLSRPVRRRSQYPTMRTMSNSLRKVEKAGDEVHQLAEYLLERLKEIAKHGQREQAREI